MNTSQDIAQAQREKQLDNEFNSNYKILSENYLPNLRETCVEVEHKTRKYKCFFGVANLLVSVILVEGF